MNSNNNELFRYLPIFLFVLVLSFLVSPLIIWFSRKIKLIAVPGTQPHHIHKTPTPMSGGLIIFITLLIATIVLELWNTPNILPSFIAAFVILLFGLWDDLKGLNAFVKLIGQIIATTFLITNGIRIQFLESPQLYFGGPIILYTILDIILTYFWVIGITNAVNFVDSMDGLAIGLVISALGSYFVGSILSGQQDTMYLCILLSGICIVLFFLNAPPARIFLGDSGAQSLGFMIAIIGILFSPQLPFQASSWFVPILIMGVPIFDTSLVVFSRLRRKLPTYRSNLDHSYHRLLSFGVSSPRAVVILNFIALILDIIAFIALIQIPLIANLIFLACLVIGISTCIFLDNKKNFERLNRYQNLHFGTSKDL